ncbi:hypothetical protein V6N13_106465 [Hibiscus sabdariffa]
MFYVPSSIHIGSLNRSSVGDGGWAVGLAEAWRMVHDLNQSELANASKPSQSPNNPDVFLIMSGSPQLYHAIRLWIQLDWEVFPQHISRSKPSGKYFSRCCSRQAY